jgi:glutathione S-transferase
MRRLLELEVGAAQMPAVELPEGRFMTDTTPIIAWLEERRPNPPVMDDRKAESERLGWHIGYSDLIQGGKLDCRDVLEAIYEEASQAVGRELRYPESD